MKNNYLLIVLLLVSTFSFSQSKEKLIKGRITAGPVTVENVEVINIANQRMVVTNAKGEFEIWAKTNDLLLFSNSNYEDFRKRLWESEYNAGKIEIKIIPIVTQLEEVVVTQTDEIGNEYKAAKQYTPAERKLATGATPVRMIQGIGISNDAIINAISGKTKMMKKEIAVEKKEAALVRIDELFEDNYFIDQLKIDKDYVDGFKYYVVNDQEFLDTLKTENKRALDKIFFHLAAEYKEVLAGEK